MAGEAATRGGVYAGRASNVDYAEARMLKHTTSLTNFAVVAGSMTEPPPQADRRAAEPAIAASHLTGALVTET